MELSPLLPASDSAERIRSSNPKGGDLSTLFPASDSVERITSSNPEIMDQRLYLESETIGELYKPTPGMWQFPRRFSEYLDLCCIYRVPDHIRHVNPEAYTPQVVLIGPLNHSLKSEALKCRGDITNTKAMNYLNMERHKKIYLVHFARRQGVGGEKEVIDEFRKIVKGEEGMIRASYSESTEWISSSDFVEMIMLDCVFIIEFILKWVIQIPAIFQNRESSNRQDISSTFPEYKQGYKTGDPLVDDVSLLCIVKRDLILLENQIPYSIFEKLYVVCIKPSTDRPLSSFRDLACLFFYPFGVRIEDNSQFKHFTDMLRCGHVEKLPEHFLKDFKSDENDVMYHADKLHSGGVKFKAVDNIHYLNVEFINGCLHIPCFSVHGSTERTLRNIIALEQCHYSYKSHVSNYICFLDLLIDTEKDVELLVEKGIIRHMLGDHSEVATMVNRLCKGASICGSQYSVIAKDVQKHYNNPWTKSIAILRFVYFSNPWRGTSTIAAMLFRFVYFSNPWRGTSTIAAMLLLLLTLVQVVFSILQFMSPS